MTKCASLVLAGAAALDRLKLSDAIAAQGAAAVQKQSHPAHALNHLMSHGPLSRPLVPKAAKLGSRPLSGAADATNNLGLHSVSLSGCSKVTDKGLSALLKGSQSARSLTSLDVSGCHKLAGGLEVPPKVCSTAVTLPQAS